MHLLLLLILILVLCWISLDLISLGLDGLEVLGLEGIRVLGSLCSLLLVLYDHVVQFCLAEGTLLGSLAFLVGFGSLLVQFKVTFYFPINLVNVLLSQFQFFLESLLLCLECILAPLGVLADKSLNFIVE